MPDTLSSVLFVNGRFVTEEEPAISALDRGFTLGDGVFETMRSANGRVFRLSQHLERLHQGATVLKLPLPQEEKLAVALQEVLSRIAGAPAIMRLTITRGIDKGRGIAIPATSTPTIAIRAGPFVPLPGEAYNQGFRAFVSSLRRNETSPLSRIKSCNYGDNILAREEARERGYDEALLLNTRGDVACATTANLFMVTRGKLSTAPVESGILPGITRACILDLASSLQIPTDETSFTLTSLLQADEAFLTNTAIGIMPLTRVGEHAIGSGKPGPVTQKLAAAYEKQLEAELSG
ncbi:MAG: hypothetical protein EXR55_02145 [Dehalococcoidia bacterium]|nr:hypothetical protein [Dehalococcoidia bacterium]